MLKPTENLSRNRGVARTMPPTIDAGAALRLTRAGLALSRGCLFSSVGLPGCPDPPERVNEMSPGHWRKERRPTFVVPGGCGPSWEVCALANGVLAAVEFIRMVHDGTIAAPNRGCNNKITHPPFAGQPSMPAESVAWPLVAAKDEGSQGES